MEYLLLSLIVFIFFFKTLQMGYCVDDNYIAENVERHKKSERKIPWTYWLYSLLFSAGVLKNVFQEHLFTMALHAANTCMVYKVTGSFMVAFLFAITPVNNQIAIWLNGRRYAVSILCVLLAWQFKYLFIPLYVFSTWLHVYAIALPILMLFTDKWFYVPIGLGLMFLVGWPRIKARFMTRRVEWSKNNELQIIRLKKIIFYIKSLGWNFFHTLLPWKPRMYSDFLYNAGRTKEGNEQAYSLNREFWKGMVVVLYIGWEIIFNHSIWALWWVIFISQYCNIITVLMNASDRYCSLAGIGLIALLVQRVNILPSPYREIVYASLITFYILKYIPLFRAYESIDKFHGYHIALDPEHPRSRLLLADIYLEQLNDPIRAMAVTKEGLKYRPKDFELILKMAKILFAMKNWDQCVRTMEVAKKYYPLGEEEEFELAFAELKAEAEKRKGLRPPLKFQQPVKPNRAQKRAMGK